MADKFNRGTVQPRRPLTRRRFLEGVTGIAGILGTARFPSIARADAPGAKGIIVLGIDGMDPALLARCIRRGLTPNCGQLAARGVTKLGTSDPPQSPVAWSNFISGSNPGLHGIFDFISMDTEKMVPQAATASPPTPGLTIPVGDYGIPLSGGQQTLHRQGPTLWDVIHREGVPSTVFRAPVNFPPTPTGARTLSGITTPDIHGAFGVFSFYSESPDTTDGDPPGGHIERIPVLQGTANCKLRGPINSLRRDRPRVDLPFTVNLNSERTLARFRIQDTELLLRPGDWSQWVTLEFPLIRHMTSVAGICRFYLKQTEPYLEFYVSPVNIHPEDPAMPIGTPDTYPRELARELGLFYTQGMPEDTAALSSRVFSDDEFREQSTMVLEEQMRFTRHEIDRYQGGFLYSYFSTLDLNSHAFWRTLDPKHPLYSEELARRHGDFLPSLYARIDEAVGWALDRAGDDSLVFVVSDHGFVPFRRQFNLNGWLMDNGFATPKEKTRRGTASFFQDTDWTRTQAYGIGINSLNLNLDGRESDGIVAPGPEAEGLRQTLVDRLLALRDDQTGEKVFKNVYKPEEIYSGPCAKTAPDLILGYNIHYRASWDTILGKYPHEILMDNLDPWSGDHCMDSSFLSGVVLCNRPIPRADPRMEDLAPSILNVLGVPVPGEMTGRSIFAAS